MKRVIKRIIGLFLGSGIAILGIYLTQTVNSFFFLVFSLIGIPMIAISLVNLMEPDNFTYDISDLIWDGEGKIQRKKRKIK